MFDANRLLEIAVADEADARLVLGDVWNGRTTLSDAGRWAMICALHLENNSIEALRFVGPFGKVPLTKGSKVKIRKGSVILTNKGPKTAGTNYTVTVHRVSEGWAGDSITGKGPEVHNPMVVWSGRDGWYRSDANNFEIVDGEAGI